MLASTVNPLMPLPLGERHRWRGTGFRKSPRKPQTVAVCYRLFPTHFLHLGSHFSKDETSIFQNSQSQRVWDYISHTVQYWCAVISCHCFLTSFKHLKRPIIFLLTSDVRSLLISLNLLITVALFWFQHAGKCLNLVPLREMLAVSFYAPLFSRPL